MKDVSIAPKVLEDSVRVPSRLWGHSMDSSTAYMIFEYMPQEYLFRNLS